jgi:pimeloyl-ACP methyl ester carboxylesterase
MNTTASARHPGAVLKKLRRFLATLVSGFAASLSAATWEAEIAPRPGDHFDLARFRLWMDDDAIKKARPPRALLLLAPGWNGDGRHLASDPNWQDLARRLDAAIVAVNLRTEIRGDADIRRYHRADQGSGAVLVRALETFARDSRRPELASLPWFACGHSAGGQWAYGLANVYPERTAAFAAIKGGVYETPFDPRSRAVPGLFIIGENNETFRAVAITTLFERERQAGALWAVAWEANSGHELGRGAELARAWFHEVAKLRLTQSRPSTLTPVPRERGLLGRRSDYSLHDTSPAPAEDSMRTVWLPGPISAKLWQDLGRPR